MTLLPAYGRDYKSKKEVLADWQAGKDFVIASYPGDPNDGRYVNRSQAIESKWSAVNIRYKRQTAVCVIPVK